MEDRRHFSASPKSVRPAAVTAIPPITVVLNASGTLAINGTLRDDDLRYVQTGATTAEVVSFVVVPAGTVAAPPTYALAKGDRPVPVHVRTITTADGTELKMSAAIDLNHVVRTQVNGFDGADTLRVDGVKRPPDATGVENTVLVPTVAAKGNTPSDPGTGRRAQNTAKWLAYSQQLLDLANQSKATTAFFGDSHIERWDAVGIASWNHYFKNALDLGIGGDGTRQLLYRIRQGLFDLFKPKTVVMMIGTNNLNDLSTGTDAQVEQGIRTVVRTLQDKIPGVKILLLGILPRRLAGFNTRVVDLNARTATLADDKSVFFYNPYDRFVGPAEDDNINPTLFETYDEHLNPTGYKVLSYYVAPLLKKIS